jgi:Glycosyl hydrolase family 26
MRHTLSPLLALSTLVATLGACGGSGGDTGSGGTPGQAAGGGGATTTAGGGQTTTAAGGQAVTGSAGQVSAGGGAPSGGGSFSAGGTPTTAAGGSAGAGRGGSGTGTGGSPQGQGGANASGGAAGAGTTTGGGGASGSGGACAVAPVSPNATSQAKNLLCYLYSIKGNHVLSGQQEANWNATPTDLNFYTSNGLKYPAILGSDFLYRSSTSCTSVTSSTTRAIAYWNAGGISMFRYHMGLPGAGRTCADDSFNNSAGSAEPTVKPNAAFFDSVVTAGTPENTSLNAKLDYVAVQISAMKAANVPIILALFHETQANGWFWWAENDSGPQFVNLWKYAFNYLTATKGLTNIIWLMPFSGSPNSAYYAGKAFVDIGGPDEYTKPTNLLTFNSSGNYPSASGIFGTAMPITLHETGAALQPDSMFPAATAPWIMWNVWAGYQTMTAYNTVASMKAAYASKYTITRDLIPSLK